MPKMRIGNDGSNILKANNTKIPDSWTEPSAIKTRTDLLEQRHQAKIPDTTYDLDGDGHVAGHDYMIAKIFDKDKDGKLNAKERKEADEAIKNVSIFKLLISYKGHS
jgi:hypothetical protein